MSARLRLTVLAAILLAPLAAPGAEPAGGASPAAAGQAATPATTQGSEGGGSEGAAPAAKAAGHAQPKAAAPAAPAVTGEPEGPLRVGLRQCLAVSAVVFGLGVMIIVIRRNAIAVLMGIELILNSAALNFVAFSKYVGKDIVDGQVVAIFLIVIAAAEAAVALAIILNIFNNLNTVTVDDADALKG